MINENFKKDLVVMKDFLLLKVATLGENALLEENFCNLLLDKILQNMVKTFVFKRF